MAGGRAERASRYYYDDDYSSDDRDRKRDQDHERDRDRRGHRRRHRSYDLDDEYAAARRERRERRRAEEVRREAQLDIDDLRARGDVYHSRPEPDRRQDSQRMAQEIRGERAKVRPRSSHKEGRRDGTRRKKRRDEVDQDRIEDDYACVRPKSRAVVEEISVKRSSPRKKSEGGGSSSRTLHSPLSGSRSVSAKAAESPKLTRSVSAREPTRVYMTTRPSLRRTSTVKLATPIAVTTPAPAPAPITRSQSVREPHHGSVQRRNTGGLFATLFRPPPRASISHKEVPKVECLICMSDEVPVNKAAKLGCGHHMCHSCLKRQFTLSVSDPQHMPPTCCTEDHIPLKHVERLFDDKFKKLWNKKYEEYTTANRFYCPMKNCGQFIRPTKFRVDLATGRKYARCGRCSTRICVLCNKKFHSRRDCPRDEETNRIVQMAKDEGWQRCYNCKTMVELKEGCNHMTCRCTAQFCMVCAAPWKTCNCPWFNYQHLDDDDRLNDMRVPHAHEANVVEVIEVPSHSAPQPVRRSSTRARRHGERDLQYVDQALSAHLHQLRMESTPAPSDFHRSDPAVQVYGLGNSAGHHMNDSYTLRPLATSVARTAARPPTSTSRFFSRRTSVRETPRTTRPVPPPAAASAMAGLSKDGSKRGANRVGTWLSHVQVDPDAIKTAPRGVEVDSWDWEGSIVGID